MARTGELRAVPDAVKDASRRLEPRFRFAGRLGQLSQGVLYLVIGLIALEASSSA